MLGDVSGIPRWQNPAQRYHGRRGVVLPQLCLRMSTGLALTAGDRVRTFCARFSAFSMLSRWHLTWFSSCKPAPAHVRCIVQSTWECLCARYSAGCATAGGRLAKMPRLGRNWLARGVGGEGGKG